jgi:hypothetical protein
MTNNAYSEEETKKLKKLYDEFGTENIEFIAEELNKTIRSVRSKLVREGLYIPMKSDYIKKTGKSKKELLRDLEEIVQFDTGGFLGATKDSLSDLISFLKKDE